MFEPCPCGGGRPFLQCCGPIHVGQRPAASAEALMRSRYAAFARGDVGYLLRSWASETRPLALTLDPDQRWTGLTILGTRDLRQGWSMVAFRADYTRAGVAGAVQERSRFRREGETWLYVDGDG